ncbi:hypothetical protein KC19_2G042000 [Ceratodon purpureus]|uniref:Uncharacterized protein n=1 Tax=Ceratodon purpureus TaxID=3225 RepID=A0A8T0IQ11_CERPU|nr:hypothetical protein KC19_2G042000 [Ceratodon purpureus]
MSIVIYALQKPLECSESGLSQLKTHNIWLILRSVITVRDAVNAGAYGYRMESSRSTGVDLRGKRRLEEDFRRNRVKEDFRDEFRGNQQVEVDFRQEFYGNRRVKERRHDSCFHIVEDLMDNRGALRADISRVHCSSANDTTGPTKGDVRSNVGVMRAGVQGLQTNTTTKTATNTPREYPSATMGHKKPDISTHKRRIESPGQSSAPSLLNALPYGPYQPCRPEGSSDDGREDESSRGRASTENGSFQLEDVNLAGGVMISNDDLNGSALKRARIMWTSVLHERFVETVRHLGIKNAVPKTIMESLTVESLTRENVASHLQKHRLYLKHTQGLSSGSPSASDHLFASTPISTGIMSLGNIIPRTGMSPHFMASSGNQSDDGGVPFTTPIIPMQF